MGTSLGSEAVRPPASEWTLRQLHPRGLCFALLFSLTALACGPREEMPSDPVPAVPPLTPESADPSKQPVPSCSEIPCAVPGADQPIGGDSRSPVEVFFGRVLDDRGEPLRARVAVFDRCPDDCPSGGPAFVAAGGTQADGSFAVPTPQWGPDATSWRTLVVESRGGFRSLSAWELPAEIVVPSVRALPLAIQLPEPPGREGVAVSMEIEWGPREHSEPWTAHGLVGWGGDLGHGSLEDGSGGLLTLSAEGSVLRATVLVPVGEVRIGVSLDRLTSNGSGARSARASYGEAIDDLELQVPPGEGPLAERSLMVPPAHAVRLSIAYRPERWQHCMRWITSLRRVGGVARVIGADLTRGADQLAVPAGTYEIGMDPECREVVEVQPGHPLTVTLGRECLVRCLPGIPFCGFGVDSNPTPRQRGTPSTEAAWTASSRAH